ncbi:hypothetical protein DFH09DRAFT_1088944 [Mycena vulgaris]|nr:hypothetical protein DFH09DRAFT_1088944 [Mycena vulgaris]
MASLGSTATAPTQLPQPAQYRAPPTPAQAQAIAFLNSLRANSSAGHAPAITGNATGLSFQLFRNDLVRVEMDRLEFWVVDPLIADAFWLSARQLCILLMSAAHGTNFAAHAAPAIPIRLPLAALRAVGLPIPTILLALSYPSNPLRLRRYTSPETADAECLLFVEWYEHNLCWLAECLRRIISNGIHTVWDFATALDISKDEFFNLITYSRKEAGLDELDILFSMVEETPCNFDDLDLGVHFPPLVSSSLRLRDARSHG